MEQGEINRILKSPICLLRRSTEEERALFPDKGKGFFHTFGLASGQRFVAHIPEKDEVYTFRPLRNLLPNLKELVWTKKEELEDLGYTTVCQVLDGTSEKEKKTYEEVLRPQPIPAPYFTMIAFKHYKYPSMLERCICFQRLNQQYEETKRALLKIQKAKRDLLISEDNNLIQQKLEERRQNG